MVLLVDVSNWWVVFKAVISRIVVFCDSFAKIFAVGAIIASAFTLFNPSLAHWIKTNLASSFGAQFVVKYEVEFQVNNTAKLTQNGQLYLTRNGARGYGDLKRGDVLLVASKQNMRENNGCATKEVCGQSTVVLELKAGQCVTVLETLYRDDGTDGKAINLPRIDGGWVRVSTSPCGLFR